MGKEAFILEYRKAGKEKYSQVSRQFGSQYAVRHTGRHICRQPTIQA